MGRKWTVILIPHDRGERRSFNLSEAFVFGMAGVVLGLCFLVAYLFNVSRDAAVRADQFERQYQALEEYVDAPNWPEAYRKALDEQEAKVRAQYQERDAALTEELTRLYQLEKDVRTISGLPPQEEEIWSTVEESEGGKGGDLDDVLQDIDLTVATDDDTPLEFYPPQLIIGLSNPSADLMLQEMRLRERSLLDLLGSMELQRDRLIHTPSVWPTDVAKRRLSSRYGRRRDPFTKQFRHHNGVDIAAPYGSEIVATADGVVSYSGWHQFLGHLVKIDHGYDLESWYGHMSKRLVEVGDTVARGDVIGKVGSTGRSTGAHIHYEVHKGGNRVNPQQFMGF